MELETPATAMAAMTAAAEGPSQDMDLQRKRKLLAARRRIIEREVMKYLIGNDNAGNVGGNNNTYEELEDNDDEYEEIIFDPFKAAQQMVTLPTAVEKRRSNSDSDLYTMMDENREVELCSTAKTVLKIRVDENDEESEVPEQGFYRVYDDLDRIREWDLIPYVLERKKREKELKELMLNKVEAEKKSPDSGRASVVSSDLSETATEQAEKAKSTKSDSGSSCSADSGTYNLFAEVREKSKSNEFLKKVTLQLSSINEKRIAMRSPPPPAPLKSSKSSSPPPPLPPRTRIRQQCPKTKDLSSHLGLISNVASDRVSQQVAHSVAMQNLPKELSNVTTPPGKKDLNRHLGILSEATVQPPPTLLKRLTPPGIPRPSQLLVQFHLSQSKEQQRQKRQRRPQQQPASNHIATVAPLRSSCRRELDFDSLEATPAIVRGNDCNSEIAKCRNESVQTSVAGAAATPAKTVTSSSVARSGGRSVASKIFKRSHHLQTPRVGRSPSPYRIKNPGAAATPLSSRRFKAKDSRRSFMANLLLSAKTKTISASADPIPQPHTSEREEEVIKIGAAEAKFREYSKNVEQALKDGLPVIPFGSSSMDEISGKAFKQPNSVYLPMDNKFVGSRLCGTWSPSSTTALAAILATPARGAHCQSCTCGASNTAASMSAIPQRMELDYVPMETPKMRQKRRKSISGIVTAPFLA